VDRERLAKYGRLYGTYDGNVPVLMVTDADLIKQIYVTNFSTFMDHVEIAGDPVDMNNVLALSGDKWKRVRSIITTAFTTSKLKQISEEALPCKENLLNLMDNLVKTGENLRVRDVYSLYVLDVMAKTFFSLDIDVYNDPKGKFVRSIQNFFPSTALDFFLVGNLPAWASSLLGISNIGNKESNEYIQKVIQFAINKRKAAGAAKKRDLLQTLVDAGNTNLEDSEKGLSEIELLANAVFFIGAAFDTTSITLSFFTWQMALNPKEQEKVYQEVLSLVGPDLKREVGYDDLPKLVYLEAAINETLRMFNTDARGFRRPVHDTTLPGTGISLPKGTIINLPFAALNYDPEYFPEPTVFKPERFLADNKGGTFGNKFMAFGDGPRKCPGVRLAYLNIKQAYAELCRRYKFVAVKETVTTNTQPAGRFMLQSDKLTVGLELRAK